MKLSQQQKDFILSHFFLGAENYVGSTKIATALLDEGKCVVAGTDCIWKGGIGNFIKTVESNTLVGCVEYHFQLESFLSSEWFQTIKDLRLRGLKKDVQKLNDEINALS